MSWSSVDASVVKGIVAHTRTCVLIASSLDAPISAANSTACALLDRGERELRSHTAAAFMDHDDPRWSRLVDEYRQSGVARGVGRLIIGEDDTLEVTATLAHTVSDDGDELFCLIFTDASEHQETLRRLHAQATIDDLTGLRNRRGFLAQAGELLHRAERGAEEYELLYVDVDFFKLINDNYGHTAGDSVLIAVAEALEGQTRPEDLICRYGGDEFVLMVRATERSAGIALRIHQAISAVNVNGHLAVSASIGRHRGQHGESIADMITAADAAMYEAKRRRAG